MQAGQKLRTEDGKNEVCLFPLDVMDITQTSSPTSLSHCCGHPTDYIGLTSVYPIYAPCSCHLIYQDDVGNTRGYQSNEPVATPTGIGYVCFSFTHDGSPPTKTEFSQGELIAHTGVAGMGTGDHTHIDQAHGEGKILVDYGIKCSYGNECFALQDSTYPYDIFYSNDTEIIETLGYVFKEYKGGVIPPEPVIGSKTKWLYYMRRYEQ